MSLLKLDSNLPDLLGQRLTTQLPGIESCAHFAPELCYGRHQGPAAHDARQAAVLLVLYPHCGSWHIPLTVRPSTMTTHGGQVSFPGGGLESGETIEQAAVREYHEELGDPGAELQILGRLSPIYVFASNFQVTPCIACLPERPQFDPNPAEVANLLEPDIVELLNPSNHGQHFIDRRRVRFNAPHIDFSEYKIWGATSVILSEFFKVIADLAD